MGIYDLKLTTLAGDPTTLSPWQGQVALIVNVASRCGLTPQYAGLEELHERYSGQGFTVLGFPSNQFMGQEPGTNEEIAEFCSSTYGVTFPMFDKIEVNGPGRHPLYQELTQYPDADGEAGDVQWNFEKFLLGRDGTVVARFRPGTEPNDPAVVAAVEAQLSRG